MDIRAHLLAGQVIPAHPLALTSSRTLDERRQNALTRYYIASGAGGIAVGVHTTQFAIREKGLYRTVLELASRTADTELEKHPRPFIRIAGACGKTDQAVREAQTARDLGYHAVLLSLAAWGGDGDEAVLAHCRAVADVLPVVGFYLQPAVGGRVFDYAFWREFAQIENVVAIKIAPFNRYRTLDVVRAVSASGRADIALYTGNDDSIIVDLLTRFPYEIDGRPAWIAGGLLGHWAVDTHRAVELMDDIKAARTGVFVPSQWLTRAAAVTDSNAALFDAANGFAGCIAGIHEVLRRQGLLEGTWCLDENEGLSPGQSEEIDRVRASYPDQCDDDFIAAHRDEWLA